MSINCMYCSTPSSSLVTMLYILPMMVHGWKLQRLSPQWWTSDGMVSFTKTSGVWSLGCANYNDWETLEAAGLGLGNVGNFKLREYVQVVHEILGTSTSLKALVATRYFIHDAAIGLDHHREQPTASRWQFRTVNEDELVATGIHYQPQQINPATAACAALLLHKTYRTRDIALQALTDVVV